MQLLTLVQATPDLDPDTTLAKSLTTDLHGEVAAMNRENFIVRMHLEAVDRFRERTTWAQLSDADREVLLVEMVIDQLTARGVMEASALYEPPFSNLHAGGPEALFGGKKNVIEGIFDTLKAVQSGLMVKAG